MFKYDGEVFEFAEKFRGDDGHIRVALWNESDEECTVAQFQRGIIELDVHCHRCGVPLGDVGLDLPMRNLCDTCFGAAVAVMAALLSWKTGNDQWSHEGAHDELEQEFVASATLRALQEGSYDYAQ